MQRFFIKYRLLAGMDQEEAAESAQIDLATYQSIEDGSKTASEQECEKLAASFGVSVEELSGQDAPYNLQSRENEYFGEVVLHFASGEHVIASVTNKKKNELLRAIANRNVSNFEMFETMDNRVVVFQVSKITDIYFSDDASGTFGPEEYNGPLRASRNDDFWYLFENKDLINCEDSIHPNVHQQVVNILEAEVIPERKEEYEQDLDFFEKRCSETVLHYSSNKTHILSHLSPKQVWLMVDSLTSEANPGPFFIDQQDMDAKLIYVNDEHLEFAWVPKHAYISGLVDYLSEVY